MQAFNRSDWMMLDNKLFGFIPGLCVDMHERRGNRGRCKIDTYEGEFSDGWRDDATQDRCFQFSRGDRPRGQHTSTNLLSVPLLQQNVCPAFPKSQSWLQTYVFFFSHVLRFILVQVLSPRSSSALWQLQTKIHCQSLSKSRPLPQRWHQPSFLFVYVFLNTFNIVVLCAAEFRPSWTRRERRGFW